MSYNNFNSYESYPSHNETMGTNKKSNWPNFLVDQQNQLFFGIFNLVFTFFIGFGFFTSLYYIFYLDKSVPKHKGARILSIISIVLGALSILFLIMMVLGIGFLAAAG